MKKLLVVDDSKAILALLNKECKKFENIIPVFATSYTETKKILEETKEGFHVALLDLNLPDAHSGEIVDLVKGYSIPSVVLSATIDEELKESIMKKGIIDFVLKNDLSSISFAIKSIRRTLQNYDTTILVVDDSKLYRTTLTNILKTQNLQILEAENGEVALDVLLNNPQISLVITDFEMPKMNGHTLTFKIREKYKKDKLGIIAISSFDKEEVIAKFLRFGANDFVHKPFTHNEIVTRVNSNLELLELFEQVRDMANRDFLTGLYNRRYFFNAGASILSKSRRKEQNLSLATIDIDFFKKINDTYGHDVGDLAIIEVKNILEKTLRTSDLLARFGGEEFCVLLDDISEEDTKSLFEKIRKDFEENAITIDSLTIKYTVSIGVCFGLGSNLEEMIKISDEALYFAKENGRNQVHIMTCSDKTL